MRHKEEFTCLGCRLLARDVHVFESMPSTNTKAMEMADDGAPEGTVVIAREQTRGRGRMGRPWHSPRGGLYLSVVLRPRIAIGEAAVIPLMAGLAVSKAISTSCNIVSNLKWPNDVLIGERKVSGVLAESSVTGEELRHVVLGIGIDVNLDREALPEDIRDRATTLRSEIGYEVDVASLYRDLMYILDMQYCRLLESGSAPVLEDWSARSSTLGREVSVQMHGGVVEGKALALDGSGALIVKQGARLVRVDHGDVVHLR